MFLCNCRRFGGALLLLATWTSLTLKMEATRSYEKYAAIYQEKWDSIPQDFNLRL
jgi:hypothetical protein